MRRASMDYEINPSTWTMIYMSHVVMYWICGGHYQPEYLIICIQKPASVACLIGITPKHKSRINLDMHERLLKWSCTLRTSHLSASFIIAFAVHGSYMCIFPFDLYTPNYALDNILYTSHMAYIKITVSPPVQYIIFKICNIIPCQAMSQTPTFGQWVHF